MLLHLSTWPEVETYLHRSQGVILPIGSTEQHGPNGLIGTDAICAEVLAKGVGETIDACVGPTIAVGMALHHLGFPGSISLRPSTLIQVIGDYLVSLSRSGFRRFFFINGHGGNVATLRAAFAETYDRLAMLSGFETVEIRCEVANWYMLPEVHRLARELYGEAEGSHATPSEVALTQYAYPEAIKTVELTPPIAPKSTGIYSAQDFRQRYPDGRMGSNPGLATPEHGKQFYEAALPALCDRYQTFLQEP
jgi:creatinine amidohydrolase